MDKKNIIIAAAVVAAVLVGIVIYQNANKEPSLSDVTNEMNRAADDMKGMMN